jgi:hypothetical protein
MVRYYPGSQQVYGVLTAILALIYFGLTICLKSLVDQVRVLLYELPPEHWAVGGQTKAMQQSSFEQQKNEVVE